MKKEQEYDCQLREKEINQVYEKVEDTIQILSLSLMFCRISAPDSMQTPHFSISHDFLSETVVPNMKKLNQS